MSIATSKKISENQQHFNDCCEYNLSFVEPIEPIWDDCGVVFKTQCNKCKKVYEESYTLYCTSTEGDTEVLKEY